jgi:hypothetical protein
LASLLGNDIVPVSKLHNFHERLKQAQKDRELVRVVVDYIKKWNFTTSCDDAVLREIAKDVFGDDRMASDLANSIQNYLSPPTGGQEGATVADTPVSDRTPVITLKCPMYQTLSIILTWYKCVTFHKLALLPALDKSWTFVLLGCSDGADQ